MAIQLQLPQTTKPIVPKVRLFRKGLVMADCGHIIDISSVGFAQGIDLAYICEGEVICEQCSSSNTLTFRYTTFYPDLPDTYAGIPVIEPVEPELKPFHSNSSCPLCSNKAFTLFNSVECSNNVCINFVEW